MTDRIARMRQFRMIVIEHPRLKVIRERISCLMEDAKSIIADNEVARIAARNRPIKVEELSLLPIVGPSGAMKSTSIRKVLSEINADAAFPAEDIPVLFVSMREVKNTRAFLGVILEQYGDAAKDVIQTSPTVDAQIVARAIYHIARIKRTVVLIIDEAHELLRHDGGKVGKQMAMLLKTMLNEGCFSIVLLGTDEMLKLFHISNELRNRCVPDEDVNLSAFDIRKADDRIYFFTFLKRLETQMVENGVVDEALGWVDTIEDRARIFDMCEGVPGVACKILKIALDRAFRAGRTSAEWRDLEAAFRAFNRNQVRPGYDPFADGPKKETLGRLKAEQAAKSKPSGRLPA